MNRLSAVTVLGLHEHYLKCRQSAGVESEVLQALQQLEQQLRLDSLHEVKLTQQSVFSTEMPLDGCVSMRKNQQQVAHLMKHARDNVHSLWTPVGRGGP